MARVRDRVRVRYRVRDRVRISLRLTLILTLTLTLNNDYTTLLILRLYCNIYSNFEVFICNRSEDRREGHKISEWVT